MRDSRRRGARWSGVVAMATEGRADVLLRTGSDVFMGEKVVLEKSCSTSVPETHFAHKT